MTVAPAQAGAQPGHACRTAVSSPHHRIGCQPSLARRFWSRLVTMSPQLRLGPNPTLNEGSLAPHRTIGLDASLRWHDELSSMFPLCRPSGGWGLNRSSMRDGCFLIAKLVWMPAFAGMTDFSNGLLCYAFKSSHKSRHSGLALIIKSVFQRRFHAFIAFSRAIASYAVA